MEMLKSAKAVRLRSRHEKYLIAAADEDHVCQDCNGASRAVRWTVKFVPGATAVLHLKYCFGRYLTASNEPFLLGVTRRKVLQTTPPPPCAAQTRRSSGSPCARNPPVEWEPVREGFLVKLKTWYGHFLGTNGGLPP